MFNNNNRLLYIPFYCNSKLIKGSEFDLEDDQEKDLNEDQHGKLATKCATLSKSYNEIVFAEQ